MTHPKQADRIDHRAQSSLDRAAKWLDAVAYHMAAGQYPAAYEATCRLRAAADNLAGDSLRLALAKPITPMDKAKADLASILRRKAGAK